MTELGDMTLTISGPPDRAAQTLEALRLIGLQAYPTKSPYPEDPEESAKSWIDIEAYPDEPHDEVKFQQSTLDAVTSAIEPFDFVLRSHGVVVANRSGSRYLNHRILMPLTPLDTIAVTENPSAALLWEQIRLEARTGIDFNAISAIPGAPSAPDIRDEFIAYISQAEAYYKAGEATEGTSAALLYYYSFLNLAKAELVLDKPDVLLDPARTKGITHGISATTEQGTIDDWELKIQGGGVFPMLYEKRLGKPWPNHIKTIRALDLFARCRECSMEFLQAEFGAIQTSGIFHAIVTNGTVSWPLLMVDHYECLDKNPPTKALIEQHFRKLPFDFSRDLHGILSVSPRFNLYQSQLLRGRTGKYVKTGDATVVANLGLEDWIPELRNVLRPLLDWPHDNDGTLSPGIDGNNLVGLPASLARYAGMYIVSSLVRYRPAALDKDKHPKQAWFLETFTRQAALKGLEAGVNHILKKPIIFTKGLRI